MARATRRQAARIGAYALDDLCRRDPAMAARREEWSSKGGRTTLARYGRAHFARLALLSRRNRRRRDDKRA